PFGIDILLYVSIWEARFAESETEAYDKSCFVRAIELRAVKHIGMKDNGIPRRQFERNRLAQPFAIGNVSARLVREISIIILREYRQAVPVLNAAHSDPYVDPVVGAA